MDILGTVFWDRMVLNTALLVEVKKIKSGNVMLVAICGRMVDN